MMNHSWSVLLESILAVLHLTSSVIYGEGCLEIMVGHTSNYTTSLGKNLQINCTYYYSNCTKQSAYNVFWYKLQGDVYVRVTPDIHTKMKSKNLSNGKTMMSLCFTNIQKSNAGIYRCQNGLTVGHNIQVSVYDSNMRTSTSLRNESSLPEEVRWMYLYSAVGTMAFVIIVIFISVMLLQRCKGHARRETQTETQQSGVKPQDPPTSSSSYIYRKMSRKEEERPTTRAEKEGSYIMYAALNHQLPPGAPIRPRRPKEESSEYADIRVLSDK
ncbi:B- and T-lymphocyte attenuator [Hippocampus comes]|uniref:B- and T-lymphocyte attenuator n=1 Tax=Hippocampus comes TaxID=109280 RepID=UPI00094F1A06|nr:PREDICTED: B- and T-lymphocyte attenuator-like [Hippocampus comes]